MIAGVLLVPFTRVRLSTRMPAHALLVRLASTLGHPGPSVFAPESGHFLGEVTARGFSLRPTMPRRDRAWRPVASGKVYASSDGATELDVTFAPPIPAVIFGVVWVGLAGVIATVVSVSAFASHQPGMLLVALWPAFIVFVGYVRFVVGFSRGVNAACTRLEQVIGGPG